MNLNAHLLALVHQISGIIKNKIQWDLDLVDKLIWLHSLRVSKIAMDNFRAFLRGDAVGVVFYQSSGTLASWYAGFEAVSLDHTEWHVFIKTRLRTRRPTLIKHITTVQRATHGCKDGKEKGWRYTKAWQIKSH